jgi:hypothetical protein
MEFQIDKATRELIEAIRTGPNASSATPADPTGF